MDLQEKQKEINIVPWKILVSYRIIGVFFAIVAILALLPFIFGPLGIKTLVYFFYIIITIPTAYGFWKMRKWIITLQGTVVVIAVLNVGLAIFQGAPKARVLVSLLVFGALFLFSYFSRSHLEGEYKKMKIIVFLTAIWAFSQILMYINK